MKTTLTLILVVLTGFYIYYLNTKSDPPAPVVEVIEEVVEEKPVKPVEIKVIELPAPIKFAEPPKTLPEGKLFTRERIKEVHDDGVKAIPGGVEVDKVGEEPGKTIVVYNKITFKVDNYKLTNDLQESIYLAERYKVAKVENAPIPVETTPPVVAVTPNTPLPAKPDNSKQIDLIDAKIKLIENQIKDLENRDNFARKAGRVSGHGATITRLHNDLIKLHQAKFALQSQ